MLARYNPATLKHGCNQIDGEEVFLSPIRSGTLGSSEPLLKGRLNGNQLTLHLDRENGGGNRRYIGQLAARFRWDSRKPEHDVIATARREQQVDETAKAIESRGPPERCAAHPTFATVPR